MKKQHLYLTCLFALIFGIYLMVPASIAVIPLTSSICGWENIATPITDAENDVVKYSSTDDPGKGTPGDFHNEIDILNVSLQILFASNLDLVIWFATDPGDSLLYQYFILIDNNSDETADYIFFSDEPVEKIPAIAFYLMRISDGYYYHLGSWQSSKDVLSGWDFSTSQIRIYYMDEIIPEIASCKVAVIAAYLGDMDFIYADFLPLTPEAGIPGFLWASTLFGLLTLLGFVILFQKNRIRF